MLQTNRARFCHHAQRKARIFHNIERVDQDDDAIGFMKFVKGLWQCMAVYSRQWQKQTRPSIAFSVTILWKKLSPPPLLSAIFNSLTWIYIQAVIRSLKTSSQPHGAQVGQNLMPREYQSFRFHAKCTDFW